MPVKFKQVAGGIFRGGEPSEADIKDLIQVRGVRHIISLDQNIAAKIRPWIERYGKNNVAHTVIPLTASVNDRSNIRYLRNNIRQLLNAAQPVFIHCRHGKDRTGLAIALYNVQARGWDCERALADAKSFGFGTGLNPAAVKLYTDAICPPKTGEDPNEIEVDINQIHDDVVWLMRDWFDAGNVPPAFEPQQSFAPEFPVDIEEPYYPILEREMSRAERKLLLHKMLERIGPSQIVQPGQYDNYSGIRGVGPVEVSGPFNI